MKTLSLDIVKNIESQIYNKGQDLDVAILNYVNGEESFVVDAISMYQNRNGGFGHGLYIDNYNVESTAFTTFYALELIYWFGGEASEKKEMLKRAFTYLYHKAYLEDELYLIAEPGNNNYAHSNEFTYPGVKDVGLTMGIIGITLLLLDESSPYYKLAIAKYNKFLQQMQVWEENENSIIFKAILIAGLNKAGIQHKFALNNKFLNVINVLKVSLYVEVPNELLARALDTLIASINNNGLWNYPLNWHNSYPEGDVAQIKWSFRQTVINYYYLKKYKLVDYH